AREADAVALGSELRHSVRRDRVGWKVLARRKRCARPVDGCRGREHDTSDALVARGEQDVQRSLDVDGARGQRILDRAWHRAESAEVVDDLCAAHGVVNALVAAQLSFDDLDLEALEIGTVSGGEIVEHTNVVAALEERSDEIRADE